MASVLLSSSQTKVLSLDPFPETLVPVELKAQESQPPNEPLVAR